GPGSVGEAGALTGTDTNGVLSLPAFGELRVGRLAADLAATGAGAGRVLLRVAAPRDPRRGAVEDAAAGPVSAEACCEDRSDEPLAPVSGASARATPVPEATAAPTPSAIASAPIRPM
ncbi:MAG: hypothetical protein O2892_01710, partial [Actinomycetota bacterium]|nr:hypothetical protein [Actinomycetota bacterium]